MTAPLAIRLHADDNVVVARTDIVAGTPIPGENVTTAAYIPAGHKLVTRAIKAGEPVRKYNQTIGFATVDIPVGAHAHTQNVAMGDFERDYAFCADARPTAFVPEAARATFRGIVRKDGRVATRNYLGVVTTVNCSAATARMIAQKAERLLDAYPNIDGVVPLTHASGCGMAVAGEGMDVLRRTLGGYAKHANFAGVLIVGLGCEANQVSGFLEAQDLKPGDFLSAMAIQEEGGVARTVGRGVDALREMMTEANKVERTTVSASHLCVGLQCGGSDGYSGITANPALGVAVDLLAQHGGTGILSETPEIYGAEHLLTRRAATRAVGEKIVERIKWWEEYTSRHKGEMNNNPSPGNKAGGLTTILEKSLGAVAKGGQTNLVEVYKYAEPVTAKGFVYMDSPGYDPVSATGQVAGGANMICFTTGRGSAYGCRPAPSLKLATNNALWNRQRDDMDINCGGVAEGEETIEECGRRIFDLILRTASGEKTKSELLGIGDDEFQPWVMGATM